MNRIYLCAGVIILAGTLASADGQTATQSSQSSPPATTPAGQKRSATKPSAGKPATAPAASSAPKVQRIPMESAPPTAPTAASAAQEAQQKAADQRLLEQQQAQSAAAAKVTNAIVDTAQRRQDKVQNEVRIQDAPGPAQTGVVPAAGPPTIPAKSSQDIQEAPGPAQTLNPAPAAPSTTIPPPPR